MFISECYSTPPPVNIWMILMEMLSKCPERVIAIGLVKGVSNDVSDLEFCEAVCSCMIISGFGSSWVVVGCSSCIW